MFYAGPGAFLCRVCIFSLCLCLSSNDNSRLCKCEGFIDFLCSPVINGRLGQGLTCLRLRTAWINASIYFLRSGDMRDRLSVPAERDLLLTGLFSGDHMSTMHFCRFPNKYISINIFKTSLFRLLPLNKPIVIDL